MVVYENLFVRSGEFFMADGIKNAQKNVHDALFYVHDSDYLG